MEIFDQPGVDSSTLSTGLRFWKKIYGPMIKIKGQNTLLLVKALQIQIPTHHLAQMRGRNIWTYDNCCNQKYLIFEIILVVTGNI